ncbi:MAG: 23S rRNA pseudouridine(1911/1915/1917) synthase RluD [Succinatimonas hippei]|nr:23S rRNA pseudouridine(1911/1915/1917) synthase RluD [Succinatimonas hippei]
MEKTLQILIPDEFHGKRADTALSKLIPDVSRSAISEAITSGQVKADGKVIAKPSDKLFSGQSIEVSLKNDEDTGAESEDIPLDVVYEDSDLAVINKPAGLVVHPGAGVHSGTLMNGLLYRYSASRQLPRAGIVHRLDKDTSGLMVVALSPKAHFHLTKAISKHQVVREYEAIACGLITAGGTIEADIGRDPLNRVRMAVVPDGMGREAVTHYRVMERFREHTLIRLRLETGRTHQIRVHMASIDHPLLGDPVYGYGLRLMKGASEEFNEELRSFRRQALHAARISFKHPITGENMDFSAPLPDDMKALIEALRKDRDEHAQD